MLDAIAAVDEDARRAVQDFGNMLGTDPAQLRPVEDRDGSGERFGHLAGAGTGNNDDIVARRSLGHHEGERGKKHGRVLVGCVARHLARRSASITPLR